MSLKSKIESLVESLMTPQVENIIYNKMTSGMVGKKFNQQIADWLNGSQPDPIVKANIQDFWQTNIKSPEAVRLRVLTKDINDGFKDSGRLTRTSEEEVQRALPRILEQ